MADTMDELIAENARLREALKLARNYVEEANDECEASGADDGGAAEVQADLETIDLALSHPTNAERIER